MNDIYLSKYLRKKSLDTFGKPHKDLGNRKFDFFIVIPCYNEFDYLFDTLDSIIYQDQDLFGQSLVVIVINNNQEEGKSVIDNNQKTYDALISKIGNGTSSTKIVATKLPQKIDRMAEQEKHYDPEILRNVESKK